MKLPDEVMARIRSIVSLEFARIIQNRPPYVSNGDVDRITDLLVKALEPVPVFSESIKQNPEEDEPVFYGAEEIDQKPLKKSAFVIFDWLATHPDEWFAPWEIARHLKVNEVTVTNRIRDFRTAQWGMHQTPKRRRAGSRVWEYTLVPNKDSFTYQNYIHSKKSNV